jgi:hypothetical protein
MLKFRGNRLEIAGGYRFGGKGLPIHPRGVAQRKKNDI